MGAAPAGRLGGRAPPSLRLRRPKEGVTRRQGQVPLPAGSPELPGKRSQPCQRPAVPSRWPPGRSPARRSEDGRRKFHQTPPEKVAPPLRAEIPAPGKRRAGRGGEDCLCLLPEPAEIVCVIGVPFVYFACLVPPVTRDGCGCAVPSPGEPSGSRQQGDEVDGVCRGQGVMGSLVSMQ